MKMIDSHLWKKIGTALGSSEKELDQNNPEQYLRDILNDWLESSGLPTFEELTRVLDKVGVKVRLPSQTATLSTGKSCRAIINVWV